MPTATKLTNLQQELLKVCSRNVSEKELIEIKDLLANYFAEKAIKGASKMWDEKGLTNEDMDNWLNEPT
jgi:hypothetical protein